MEKKYWTPEKELKNTANTQIIGKVRSVKNLEKRSVKNFSIEGRTGGLIHCEAWTDKADEIDDLDIKENQVIKLTNVKVTGSTFYNKKDGHVPFTVKTGTQSKCEISGGSSATRKLPRDAMKGGEDDGFKALMSKFLKLCNRFFAHETVAIVEVMGPPGVKKVTMAFRNYEEIHAEVNFINWWNHEYERKNKSDEKRTEIMMYINHTPCINCAEKLREWLEEKNAGEKEWLTLTIHFSFVYTPTETRDKSEYIKEVATALGNRGNNGNLRMQKINQDMLIALLEGFDTLPFKGYPSYDSFELEKEIRGYWSKPDVVSNKEPNKKSDEELNNIVSRTNELSISKASS